MKERRREEGGREGGSEKGEKRMENKGRERRKEVEREWRTGRRGDVRELLFSSAYCFFRGAERRNKSVEADSSQNNDRMMKSIGTKKVRGKRGDREERKDDREEGREVVHKRNLFHIFFSR